MTDKTPKIGFLVKPATREIIPLQFSGDLGFKQLAGAIESGSGYIDIIPVSEDGDVVYVDDEGRMNGAAEKFGQFWLVGTEGSALVVGNGILMGTDDAGDTCDPEMDLAEFTAMVKWERPEGNDDDGEPSITVIALD